MMMQPQHAAAYLVQLQFELVWLPPEYSLSLDQLLILLPKDNIVVEPCCNLLASCICQGCRERLQAST